MRTFLAILLLAASSAMAETRIKDVTSIHGMRDNMLVGYGIVVGLSSTGDNIKNSVFTEKGIIDYLEKLGLNTQGANLKTKNVAAVMVTANLPAFARQGRRIDVKVSSIGDAKSLKNGSLLATPLLGADGNVYVVAQGPITIPDFQPASEDVKTKAFVRENNGFIQNGGIVETELDFELKDSGKIRLTVNSPDFATALNIANSINNNITGNTATALDPATVDVTIPNYRKDEIVQFISEIESLTVDPDYRAKVVIDEATSTVVMGANVRVRSVAITQGNLVINIEDLANADYAPATKEDRQATIDVAVDKRRGRGAHLLDAGASLSDLVAGLNQLGVYPKDIVNILYNLKSVGALDAALEVR